METTVSAIEMRRQFGGILDRVAKKGEHITILRDEKPIATLIPVKEHEEQCLSKDRARRVEEVLAEVDEFWKKNPALKKKMARKDSTQIIRKMRDSRWSSSTRR